MLNTLELDYVQHLERGYCENHPDVIAQTKEQVVDRAVKQLFEALQANGFELDGNILKRGDGWLQYDAVTSAWQYSNDSGVTWLPLTQGVTDHTLLSNIGNNTHAQIDTHLADTGIHGAHPPAAVASPVTIGTAIQLRDNDGALEISEDGGDWYPPFYKGAGMSMSLAGMDFLPPYVTQETEPSLVGSAMILWRQTSSNRVWLLYKWDEAQKKVELLPAGGIVGEIKMISFSTPPAGWLLCNGQTVLRSSPLGTLYGALSYPYGVGDGSTTCNVPDLRDVFPLGAGLSHPLGASGGAETITISVSETPSHTHNSAIPYASAAGSADTFVRGGTQEGTISITSTSTGSGKSHSNMPPYVGVGFMVFAG